MLMRQLRRHGYDTISFSNFADRHNALWFMYGWTEFHTVNLKGGDETAEEVNRPLLEWLKNNAKRENYLLHINYWDAHRCYKMDGSWADRFKDYPVEQSWPDEETIQKHQNIKGMFTAQEQFDDNRSPFALMPGSISSRRDFEHMITGYDSAIAYVDHHLSQVLEEYDRQGILDDTVIIISADHGDAFGEHGIYSDHVCADECIHKIPLIIKWPGVSAVNKKSDGFLYNVDLGPTLCDILDMPVPGEWDGLSFRENVEGGKGLDRDHLVWDTALYTVQRCVRTREHLMMRTYDDFGYAFEPVELYNIKDDPFQTKNIAQSDQDIVKKCDALMDEWKNEQLSKEKDIMDPLEKVLLERKSPG
jgi:arylsulfatase A-like enzyme